MSESSINHCRVCGWYMMDPPWGEDGLTPTYEICPCCGVEFGNEDYTKESTLEYRKKWLSNSAKWFKERMKPDNWNLEKQMKNIPDKYK